MVKMRLTRCRNPIMTIMKPQKVTRFVHQMLSEKLTSTLPVKVRTHILNMNKTKMNKNKKGKNLSLNDECLLDRPMEGT